MDTTRADRCSFEGYGRKTTPRLDEFAKDAVVFTEAWSPAGWTGPAQVSKGLDLQYENLDRGYVELLETRPARDVVRYDLRILRRTLATMLRHEGLSY